MSGFFGWTADNEGSPGFIDEKIINFVNDGEVRFTLDTLGEFYHHIISEVVETEVAGGTVGDIGFIGFNPVDRSEMSPVVVLLAGVIIGIVESCRRVFGRILLGIDAGYGYSKCMVDRTHPVGTLSG